MILGINKEKQMLIGKTSYCEGCKWCCEDSLSTDDDLYYSCGNEKSDNYLVREDDLTWCYPNGKCPDKECW